MCGRSRRAQAAPKRCQCACDDPAAHSGVACFTSPSLVHKLHLHETALLNSCPGQDEGESFLSTWSQLTATVIIFGVIFVMDCKCSMWTTWWASCQFLPLLAQLDRVKHPQWSFCVGIRSFGRTAMVVAFKCFLRKRCGFACNTFSQPCWTTQKTFAECFKRRLLITERVQKTECKLIFT